MSLQLATASTPNIARASHIWVILRATNEKYLQSKQRGRIKLAIIAQSGICIVQKRLPIENISRCLSSKDAFQSFWDPWKEASFTGLKKGQYLATSAWSWKFEFKFHKVTPLTKLWWKKAKIAKCFRINGSMMALDSIIIPAVTILVWLSTAQYGQVVECCPVLSTEAQYSYSNALHCQYCLVLPSVVEYCLILPSVVEYCLVLPSVVEQLRRSWPSCIPAAGGCIMTAKPRKTTAAGFIEICDIVTLPSWTFSESVTILGEQKVQMRKIKKKMSTD